MVPRLGHGTSDNGTSAVLETVDTPNKLWAISYRIITNAIKGHSKPGKQDIQ